jgi:hypothetical protein
VHLVGFCNILLYLIPCMGGNFSMCRFHISYKDQPVSDLMCPARSLPGEKQMERKSSHSPQFCVKAVSPSTF